MSGPQDPTTSRPPARRVMRVVVWVGGGLIAARLFFSGAQRQADPVSTRPEVGGGGVRAALAEPLGDSGGVRKSVVARARLEPEGRVISVAGLPADRVGEIFVKAGQHVNSGEPLAHAQSYAVRVAERELATQRAKDAEAQLVGERAVGQGLVEKAELAEKRAESDAHAVRVQEASVRLIEAELAHARLEAKRQASLKDKAASTTQALEQAELDVERRGAELAKAKEQLEQLQIQLELSRKEAAAGLRVARAKSTLAQIKARVEALKREEILAIAKAEDTIIRAPRSGQILKVLLSPGERMDSQPILEMGATENMFAVAEVYETDVRFVRKGQKVTLTSAALPTALEGTVEEVGLLIDHNQLVGDDPTARRDARVFEVRIRLASSEVADHFTNLEVQAHIATAGG